MPRTKKTQTAVEPTLEEELEMNTPIDEDLDNLSVDEEPVEVKPARKTPKPKAAKNAVPKAAKKPAKSAVPEAAVPEVVEVPVKTPKRSNTATAAAKKAPAKRSTKKVVVETAPVEATPVETPVKPAKAAKAAKPAKAPKEPVKADVVEKSSDTRTFKLVVDSVEPSVEGMAPGRYTGKTPMQAGKKVFTKIANNVDRTKGCEFVFTIQEMTRGSNHSQHTYRGEREMLDEPTTFMRGGKEQTITYKNNVRAQKTQSE